MYSGRKILKYTTGSYDKILSGFVETRSLYKKNFCFRQANYIRLPGSTYNSDELQDDNETDRSVPEPYQALPT